LVSFLLSAALLCAGCGGGSGDCPDIAGTWKILSHCESSLVGNPVTIAQDGCAFLADWGGDQPFSGKFSGSHGTMTGDTGSQTLTCEGDLANNVWSVDCTPGACHIVVEKQGGTDCPDVAGSWTIRDHCEASLVGDPVVITQNGCSFTADWGGGSVFTGTFTGNTGTMTGDTGSQTLTCTGDLVSDTWTVDCTPGNCQVVVQKNQ
jgi:hypothetical protein